MDKGDSGGGGGGEDDTQTSVPQAAIDDFWDSLITKKPAKVTKIFPQSLYKNLLPPQHAVGTVVGKNAAESYKAAAAECSARVRRIVKECIRTNEKFTDPDFDISNLYDRNCLEGLMFWYNDPPDIWPTVSASRLGSALTTLVQSGVVTGDVVPFNINDTAKLLTRSSKKSNSDSPRSVHRVDWIFEEPQFVIDGFSSSDLRQGSSGDCWFIAAVSTICTNPALMHKVCVDKDEECGVYGFVFYRDGEWVWTVVDDSLYLNYGDFDAELGDRYDPTNARETKYKKYYQTGSEALYFASCIHENETWLPLLEKAYAKIHGDYDAIAGGWSGEAVEDLTGGVTTKIMTNRVLRKDKLWEELLQVGKDFLFSASSPSSSCFGEESDALRGLALSHAYSILKAVEEPDENGKKFRLVLIRNPWGRRENARVGEWTGPWSDGSREWTPYWLEKLGHKFGDDGLFWMSYDDLLKRFDLLDRTRLFDEHWTVVQRWTSVSVAWVTGYLNSKFSVKIHKAGPTVFVLCQLDERYFKGLEGKYSFDLHFVLQEKNAKSGEHLVRARGAWFGNRSISAEVDLEAGVYEVVPKIVATRDPDVPEVLSIVKKLAQRNPQKLRQIGLNYDMANAKGVFELPEEDKKKKEQEKKDLEEQKAKEKEAEEKEKAEFEAWKKEEKAAFEAWRKKREDKDKAREKSNEASASKDEVKNSETQTVPTDAPTDPNANAEKEKDKASLPTSEENKAEVKTDLPLKPAGSEPKPPTADDTANPDPQDTTTQDIRPSTPSPDSPRKPDSANHTPNSDASEPLLASQPSASQSLPPSPPPPPHHQYHQPPVYADGPAPPAAAAASSTPKDTDQDPPKPWNAVCTLGLRVYSLDPHVTIQLVKPQSDEEGAILDVDGGGTQAGATM